MNKITLLFIVFTALISGISFIMTNSIYFVIGIAIVYIIYFLLIGNVFIRKYFKNIKRFDSCYNFMNTFLIGVNLKGNLYQAFEYVEQIMDKDYLDIYNGIKGLKDEEKLEYLSSYYPYDIYRIFLQLIKVFKISKIDIIQLSNNLVNEARQINDSLTKKRNLNRNKVIEFSILWIFSLVILVILRFTLSRFFVQLSSNLIYLISIGIYFAFLLISIHYLITKVTSIYIKGYKNE